MKKHLKKKIFLLDKYRKYIRQIKNIFFYRKKIFLICQYIFLGGFSLKLLKEYFCSKISEIYNYKDNFQFLIINFRNL